MTPARPPRTRRLAVLVLAGAVALGATACSGAGGDEPLRAEARLDGTPLETATGRSAVTLHPDRTATLDLTLENLTDEPVTVNHLRLEGELLGLTFLTYDLRVLLEVPANGTRSVELPLDFFDLDGQAHGFLRTHLRTYDAERDRLSSDEFAVDVRGRPLSTMSVFALLLMGITAATAAFSLRDLARGTLPEHRMQRGIRFLVPGLGVGLLITAVASILRIFPLPSSGSWSLVAICAGAAFAAGYVLTAAPDLDDDDELADEELETV